MPFKHTFLWILTTYPLFLVWVSTLLFIFSCSWSVKFLCKHSSNNTKEKLSDYTWKYETALVVQLQKDSFKTLVKLICSFMRECCWDKEAIWYETCLSNCIIKSIKISISSNIVWDEGTTFITKHHTHPAFVPFFFSLSCDFFLHPFDFMWL